MVDPNFRNWRIRDEGYLDWIRQQPCCICGDDVFVEAAHLRVSSINIGKNGTGMGEKPSDKWALPLCGKHHREQHTMNRGNSGLVITSTRSAWRSGIRPGARPV